MKNFFLNRKLYYKTCLLLSLVPQLYANSKLNYQHNLSTEVSISNQISQIKEVYSRNYDLSGGKSEFIWGTSVAGNVGVQSPLLGFSQPGGILPLQNSGIVIHSLVWAPWDVGLGATNGLLKDLRPQPAILDTPITHIHWQRTAFGGNNFALDFRRNLMDSLLLNLNIQSLSTDSSGSFRYLEQTHQLFVGVLGRDSSSIPFSGRNLKFDAFSFHPQITLLKSWGHIGAQVNWIKQHSDDATRHHPEYDPLNHRYTYKVAPYETHIADDGIKLFAKAKLNPQLHFNFDHHFTGIKHRYENTPYHSLKDFSSSQERIDTAYLSPLKWYEKGQIHRGEYSLAFLKYNVKLSHQYETQRFNQWLNRDFKNSPSMLWQDEQSWLAQWQNKLKLTDFSMHSHLQAALHRMGNNEDKAFWKPAFSLNFHLFYQNKWKLELAHRQNPAWPQLKQSHFMRTERLSFPNQALKAEQHYTNYATISYHTSEVGYGLRLRHQLVNNAIRPGWLAYPNYYALADSIAFKNYNFRQLGAYSWAPWLEIHLGNWQGWIERESVLKSWIIGASPTLHIPNRLYKGGVYWNSRAVQDRLGIQVGWDFQWLAGHHIFTLENPELTDYYMPQMAIRDKTPHHLSLNFHTKMQIKTFELYGRIDNMNHAKIIHDAGYTPPGIVFSYGIIWLLQN
ncbi:MAG: hypothetical protein GX801_05560 [Fibrobacter sp.]|nr:hypothetical protein [Fibrobacter sp.]